jgi:transcriptional regulator with GAF, ATPase, and Fis domain
MLSSQSLASILDAISSASGLDKPKLAIRVGVAWKPVSGATEILDDATSSLLGQLHRESVLERKGNSIAVLLPTRVAASALYWSETKPQANEIILRCISWFASLLDALLEAEQNANAKSRLEKIAFYSSKWIGIRDIKELLDAMATTAVDLFGADRASIFLADKRSRQLVGYPATGIAKGELRVPDNAGIVGSVYQSLQPRRWQQTDPVDEVNRAVDQSSGYRTKSLLAVPLLDRRGKPLGVFELINARDGSFTSLDQEMLGHLASIAATAIATTQQVQHLLSGRNSVVNSQSKAFDQIGDSAAIQKLSNELRAVATTDLPVLLIGENGTGKEVAARSVHAMSTRANQPFIAVNCAAITETLLESELFGHERGAFTDAVESRIGKFELASGGTLMLDEIGDMSSAGQAKLLRVLEERTVMKVGGSDSISVNVRVIAATNQDLPSMIAAGRFREDLYYRLSVVPIEVPPLRERQSDIVALAQYFLNSFCNEYQREVIRLSENAVEKLKQHAWPGNIRELRNLMHRLSALHQGELIEAEHMNFVASARSSVPQEINDYRSKTLADATNEFQTVVIEQHVDAADRNMTQAAETLGLQRSNLYRKMKQLGMKQR